GRHSGIWNDGPIALYGRDQPFVPSFIIIKLVIVVAMKITVTISGPTSVLGQKNNLQQLRTEGFKQFI
ncbi:hypothetical protein, partial [Lentilactobacillus buchneri]